MKNLLNLSTLPAIGFCMSITLALSACQSNPFTHPPTPESRYVPDLVLGTAQTFSIAPTRQACQSILPMQCLLATDANGQTFQIPYDGIEDFIPVQGVSYRINVRPLIDQNNGQAVGKWQLVEILAQH